MNLNRFDLLLRCSLCCPSRLGLAVLGRARSPIECRLPRSPRGAGQKAERRCCRHIRRNGVRRPQCGLRLPPGQRLLLFLRLSEPGAALLIAPEVPEKDRPSLYRDTLPSRPQPGAGEVDGAQAGRGQSAGAGDHRLRPGGQPRPTAAATGTVAGSRTAASTSTCPRVANRMPQPTRWTGCAALTPCLPGSRPRTSNQRIAEFANGEGRGRDRTHPPRHGCLDRSPHCSVADAQARAQRARHFSPHAVRI